MSEMNLEEVSKTFGDVTAVDELSLPFEKGELVALLGPSGCGKTTTLRMLGGFTTPTSGRVLLRDEDVTRVPPHRRDTSMVFQSYALFPHLTVWKNVAYGLRRRRIRGQELKDRVEAALELVRISDLRDRKPSALSGGQQQRVAVARSLVCEPAVLLFDEPFSALDAQLRQSTRVELRRIQQETNTTAVFVTHDQEEAMSISDRVAVMNEGRLEQWGRPDEIYDKPATRFVADFVGAANVLFGEIAGANGRKLTMRAEAGFMLEAQMEAGEMNGHAPGQQVNAVVRSEDILMVPAPTPGQAATVPNEATGDVEVVSFLGSLAQVTVSVGEKIVTVRGDRGLASEFRHGDRVTLRWDADKVRVLAAPKDVDSAGV